MRIARLSVVSLVFLGLLLVGCTRIYYHVTANSDPEWDRPPFTSFGLSRSLSPDASDAIVEKRILRIIRSELTNAGLVEDSSGVADLNFQVRFDMIRDKKTYQQGTYTWYDTKGRAHQGGGRGGTKTVFARTVQVVCFDNRVSKSTPVWIADCFSEGSTPDIVLAAEHMIPFALQKFPQDGTWKKKESMYTGNQGFEARRVCHSRGGGNLLLSS